MNLLNIPQSHITSQSDDKITYDFDLTVSTLDDKVRFAVGDISTSWMDSNDEFITRIQFENLNRCFISNHLRKEIEIKNLLDDGRKYLEAEKYPKAIERFDEAIYYDKNYAEALLLKSHALFGEGHFIKALRYYKRTLKANAYLKDIDYHKLLLARSSEERDNFPKIKLFIYTGDEHFARCDFKKAIESYDKALANPSRFKSKILFKLLNKKGTALFKLQKFDEALDCFKNSLDVKWNDYACFMCGFSSHSLKLPLDDSFARPLKITKDEQLYQALILNEAKRYDDAIKCVDDLLSVHFVADKIYFIALSCKISSIEALGMDADHEKYLLDMIQF